MSGAMGMPGMGVGVGGAGGMPGAMGMAGPQPMGYGSAGGADEPGLVRHDVGLRPAVQLRVRAEP